MAAKQLDPGRKKPRATPHYLGITKEEMEAFDPNAPLTPEEAEADDEMRELALEWWANWESSHRIPGANPLYADDPSFLTMYSISDLANLPKTEWLVDGLLEARQMNLYYGPSGTGKTAVVSELVWSWLAGLDYWLEPRFKIHQAVPQAERRALYIILEGSEGYYQRADAWLDAYQLGVEVLDGLKLVTDSVMLFRQKQVPNEPKSWSDSLKLLTRNLDAYQPQVVVIDTMYRATAGMDVNSPDMSSVVGALQEIINVYGCTLVLLHHSPKANKNTAAGHGSLENAVSVRILVEKTESGKNRKLEVKKYRNAEEPIGPLVLFSFSSHRSGFVLNRESNPSHAPSNKYDEVVGMTVAAAAEFLGVTEKTVYNAVLGRPSLQTVDGIVTRIEAEEAGDV